MLNELQNEKKKLIHCRGALSEEYTVSRNSVASFIRINVRFALVKMVKLFYKKEEEEEEEKEKEGEEGGKRKRTSINPRSKRDCQPCLFPNVERAYCNIIKCLLFPSTKIQKLKFSSTPEKRWFCK